MRIPTLILGAGLCGLSCAYHLGDGSRYRLLEREAQVGGLARSRPRPGGFLCDGTGHWLHLQHADTRALVERLLGDNLSERKRRARVYVQGRFTGYPFQSNLYGMPAEVVVECVLGLVEATSRNGTPANYLEWLTEQFGEGFCRHFMVPYNRKVYGVPLETLALSCASRFLPRPTLETVLRGALAPSEADLGYNVRFLYPRQGGIGALAQALHRNLARPAETGRQPLALDLEHRSATLDGGEVVEFERLVSTIPLPALVRLCQAVPDEVMQAASRLRASSVVYFDVGVKGAPQEHQDYHWVYFPEPEFAFYRMGSYSAVEPSLAPPGHRSYYVEFGGPCSDPGRLEAPLLEGLRRCGIITHEDEVLFMVANRIEPAYVLCDHAYDAARSLVLDWLGGRGVTSVGRYGRWQYTGMEDALREGQEAASSA